MKIRANWVLAVVGLLATSRPGRAQDAPPKPPELRELDRIVGTWDTEVVFRPAIWAPEERRFKGKVTSAWILDGRFLREDGNSLGEGIGHSVTWTYDAKAKSYREWYFDSMGIAIEWRGGWDGGTKTFTYKADLGDGITAVATQHFLDGDHYEIGVVAKDKEGKVYMDMHAQHARRK